MTDLLTKYVLKERIHTGGEGRLFRAFRIEDNLEVAIKFYNEEAELDNWDDFEKAKIGAEKEVAFLYKAQKDSRKDVADIVEHGHTGALEEPTMVMKKIAGETLEQTVKKPGFNPVLEDALEMVKTVAETLNYAHNDVGIEPFTHRDIKPGNIMKTDDDKYIVLDWSTGKVGSGNTLINTVLNSLWYTAPEVAEGRSVTPVADVYSLARVLQHYFLGDQFSRKFGEVKREDFNKIPDNIVDVIFKATAEDPNKRYQSVDEFVKALETKALVKVEEEKGLSKNKNEKSLFDVNSTFITYNLGVQSLITASFMVYIGGVFGDSGIGPTPDGISPLLIMAAGGAMCYINSATLPKLYLKNRPTLVKAGKRLVNWEKSPVLNAGKKVGKALKRGALSSMFYLSGVGAGYNFSKGNYPDKTHQRVMMTNEEYGRNLKEISGDGSRDLGEFYAKKSLVERKVEAEGRAISSTEKYSVRDNGTYSSPNPELTRRLDNNFESLLISNKNNFDNDDLKYRK